MRGSHRVRRLAGGRLEILEFDDKHENENTDVNAWDIPAQGVNNFVTTCWRLDITKQFSHALPHHRLSHITAQTSAASDMGLHAFHRN